MKTLAVSAIALGAGFALFSSHANAMSPLSPAFTTASPAPIIHVAHAGAPYKNVDKRNDAGNDTGDSQTDKLNDDSLQRARGK